MWTGEIFAVGCLLALMLAAMMYGIMGEYNEALTLRLVISGVSAYAVGVVAAMVANFHNPKVKK